ncbi:MAG TPA: hypothetical protein DEV93_03760 [Chloroflexi bacterium]|jgi:hypothetical protein|nr:hypothetical protein [Chloroflexota bacterium]
MTRRDLPPLPAFDRVIAFQKIRPDENCYRAYSIAVTADVHGWNVVTQRGRIGAAQRQIVERVSSRAGAMEIAVRRAHTRLLHNYEVVHA